MWVNTMRYKVFLPKSQNRYNQQNIPYKHFCYKYIISKIFTKIKIQTTNPLRDTKVLHKKTIHAIFCKIIIIFPVIFCVSCFIYLFSCYITKINFDQISHPSREWRRISRLHLWCLFFCFFFSWRILLFMIFCYFHKQ